MSTPGVTIGVALGLAVLGLCVAPPLASAQDATQRPAVQVTPGRVRAFRAAVQRFADDSTLANPAGAAADPARAERLRAAIDGALEFGGILVPLPRAAYLGPDATTAFEDAQRINCGAWTLSGGDALVEGRISDGAPGQVVVEYRVWDTARCIRLVRGSATWPVVQLERAGRAVADDVVAAFTGRRGVASTEIAFVSDRSGSREVYVMDADGSNARATTSWSSIKTFPSWHPDGDAILYSAYYRGGIASLFVTGRGRLRPGPILERVLPGAAKYRGVFSPAGDSLAVVASLDGEVELYTVGISGRGLRQLTNNRSIDISPSWSPDGRHLAFVSDRSGSPQIYVMDRDGKNARRLTFQGSYNTAPAWSPDGSWIAYETRVEGGQFDIWIIDPTGEVNLPVVSHRRDDESPSWSPDSRKLAFASTRRGRSDIYVVDLNGENPLRITSGTSDNKSPAWGPHPK